MENSNQTDVYEILSGIPQILKIGGSLAFITIVGAIRYVNYVYRDYQDLGIIDHLGIIDDSSNISTIDNESVSDRSWRQNSNNVSTNYTSHDSSYSLNQRLL